MRGDKLFRLEALRGLAALAVVISHVLLAFWPDLVRNDAVFPLVRVLYSGQFAVNVFFVLSGFVLSVSFFRTRDVRVLTTAALRRYFRLCLPVAASILLAYALLQAGLMFNGEAAAAQAQGPRAWLAKFYAFPPSLGAALREGFYGAFFAHRPVLTYNAVVWTMSIELKGSFLVFAFLALFGNMPRRGLLYLVGAPLFFFLAPPMTYFLLGIALCDLIVGRDRSRPWSRLLCVGSVLAGLMLGGLSPTWAVNLGVPWLVSWFALWMPVGAVLVVFGVAASKPRATPSARGPLRFLGRISFSLYLLHFPLLFSLGCWMFLRLSGDAEWSHAASATTAGAVSVCASLLAGWLGAVTIEDYSIRIGHRFAHRILSPSARSG